MKITKTLSAMLLASLCMSIFFCGCSNSAETTKKRGGDDDRDRSKDTQTDVKLPENETLALLSYNNEAWGHQSSRIYIQSDGSVYYSLETFEGYYQYFNGGITDEERLALLQKYTKPVASIDIKDLKKVYGYMLKIDPDAEFEYSDEYACDAGTHITEVFVKGKCIKISESGDCNGTLDDRYAKKADELLTELIRSQNGLNSVNVYSGTETFIDTFECPVTPGEPLRRIITNERELAEFKEETGIDLKSLDSFEYFGDPEYDAFGFLCIAVEIYEYHVRYKPVEADAFIISEDYTGFASLDDYIDMTYNMAETKFYCHVVQLPNYEGTAQYDYEAFLSGK